MIILLLCIALIYLIVLSVILGMNLKSFIPLDDYIDFSPNRKTPLVSICIPARNEERTIRRAVVSSLKQQYPSIEVLVLNDESTDQTSEILKNIKINHPKKLTLINGLPKPENWLGKSWACHQLSEKARGEVLFFIDADVWLQPKTVGRAMVSLNNYDLDFLTVWPIQKLQTFWEKVVIPLIYYGLLSLLPERYVYKKPGWLPSTLADRFFPAFAAACGQCMVFRKTPYKQIGGHQTVKMEIVEDVALAKLIKLHGFRMRMFHGEHSVWCRMYTSGQEMWQGFRKNFLALYNNSVIAFSLMAILNLTVYVFPFVVLIISILQANWWYIMLSASAIFLMSMHRLILARWFHWNAWFAILQSIGILWFSILSLQVLKDYCFATKVKWKNRATN